MNQIEMNRIAMNYIYAKSTEIAKEVIDVLNNDLKSSANSDSFECSRHIHNLALYNIATQINCPVNSDEDNEEEIAAYFKVVKQKEPQFLELCASLREFDPKSEGNCSETDAA